MQLSADYSLPANTDNQLGLCLIHGAIKNRRDGVKAL